MRKIIPVLLILAACAGGKDAVLTSTLAGVNAARDAFVAWDADHQSKIVDGATGLADGQAKLAAYRKDRAKASAAFVAAYGAISIASINGSGESYVAAVGAAHALLQALRTLGVLP